MTRFAALFAALVLSVGAAWAEPTDVANVPTAEVRAPGEVLLGLQQDVYRDADSLDDDKRTTLLTSFGLLPQIEVGLDVQEVNDDAALEGDVKWRFLDGGPRGIGAAIGAYNIGDDVDPVVYGVATGRGGPASFTAGLGGHDQIGLLFAGTYDLARSVQVFVEYDDALDLGRASVGGQWRPVPGLRALAYYTNGDEDLNEVRVELKVSARLLGFGA